MTIVYIINNFLVFKNGRWQSNNNRMSSNGGIIKIITAFTVAHSITLALSVLEIVSFPSRWVETAIAISVLLACINIFYPIVRKHLWSLVFVFGLLHGFGFANVLMDLGLPGSSLATALLGFNLGVELGQLAIVITFLLLASFFCRRWWYGSYVLKGGTSITAVIASVWIYERLFNYEILGF